MRPVFTLSEGAILYVFSRYYYTKQNVYLQVDARNENALVDQKSVTTYSNGTLQNERLLLLYHAVD